MAVWTVIAKKADFTKISSHFGIDPVVARVIRNRDVVTEEEIRDFLYGGEESFIDPLLLKDMDKAVDLILKEIAEGTPIRIIGDYDVDGVTSTCILVKGLRFLGGQVDYAIPNRITDGYGVNENLVKDAASAGIGLIITCDNGIAAKDALEYAVKSGIRCLITDHHEVPYKEEKGKRTYIYPEVDAIVNPKRDDSEYPFQGICGAFVAYKVITAVFDRIRKDESLRAGFPAFERQEDVTNLLMELRELAGLGTVCDVMELKNENRALVRLALNDMKNSRNRGLRALMKVCEISPDNLKAFHLGFIIGPCINATGRLEDATLSLEMLLAENDGDAVVRATELKKLNEQRKSMTEKGLEKACEIIEKEGIDKDKVMVVFVPELHESLAGIVAGRIREKYYKPVFVITATEEGLKGSGRSIEGYHMYDSMVEVGELFTKYGGHAMAAGLSMEEKSLPEFRKKINENCRLTEDDFQEKIHIDVPMPVSYVSEKLIADLELLEPYGTGNPHPIFAQKDAKILSAKRMGKAGNMARLSFTTGDGGIYEGVIFRGLEEFLEAAADKCGKDAVDKLFSSGYKGSSLVIMDIIYSPGINEYMGRRSLQFTINAFK